MILWLSLKIIQVMHAGHYKLQLWHKKESTDNARQKHKCLVCHMVKSWACQWDLATCNNGKTDTYICHMLQCTDGIQTNYFPTHNGSDNHMRSHQVSLSDKRDRYSTITSRVECCNWKQVLGNPRSKEALKESPHNLDATRQPILFAWTCKLL